MSGWIPQGIYRRVVRSLLPAGPQAGPGHLPRAAVDELPERPLRSSATSATSRNLLLNFLTRRTSSPTNMKTAIASRRGSAAASGAFRRSAGPSAGAKTCLPPSGGACHRHLRALRPGPELNFFLVFPKKYPLGRLASDQKIPYNSTIDDISQTARLPCSMGGAP